jgi:nucleotide-binding universal stress UspA family protein
MNKILIPVDFEKQSLQAIEQSFSLAHTILAEITLLYVHEPSGIFSSIFSDDQKSEILILINERLAEIAGKAALSSGVTVNYRIEKGKIYSKIIDVAKEINAQFIVMGTHSSDQESEQGKRVGSNTSKVVRSAKCPVITVNGNHIHSGCRNILLPLDLTKESRQKVTLGIEIARYYHAGIKVVSAFLTKNEKAEAGRLYQQGEQVVDFIASAGIDCSFEVIEMKDDEKTFVPAILKYAEQQGDIDLIIILTTQEVGLVEYFVGSTSQDFIRLSDTPVMSIHPKDLTVGSSF